MLEAPLEKRFTISVRGNVFVILFFNSCDFHESRQHFITSLMLVLNFAF